VREKEELNNARRFYRGPAKVEGNRRVSSMSKIWEGKVAEKIHAPKDDSLHPMRESSGKTAEDLQLLLLLELLDPLLMLLESAESRRVDFSCDDESFVEDDRPPGRDRSRSDPSGKLLS